MAMFVRVIDSGSFSAAARTVGKTPSAVSRQIARLEAKLGVRLLVRSTRKLQLSEVGQGVYGACCKMLAAAQSASDVVGQFMMRPHGLVRISAPVSYGKVVISPLVAAFLERQPDVDVQLLLTDRQVDLIDDDIDLAIRIGQEPPLGLVARALTPVRHVLCASAGYLERIGAPPTPQALDSHSCLFFGEHVDDCKWQLVRGAEQVNVKVRGRFIVNHSEAMLEAVCDGAGIGFLPSFTAGRALQCRRVVQLFPDWQLVSAYHGTAWLLSLPNRNLPPKVRVLIDHLNGALRPQREPSENV
ncbi:LysR family transcriptional regulator [Oxalobacteraceae bacterium]|nr:LysR family transcriptional regulator [Oxalobacteraceae bacterium]